MIPNPDQLQAISRMQKGNLTEVPFAVLLHALAVHQRTAVLEIDRGPLKKEILLEDGVPVDCRSNLLHETLGRFMVSRGDLTEEAYQDGLAKSATRGLQFGETLILEGQITASELYRILQQNLAKKLLDGFTWRSGEFRLLARLPDVDSPLKVNTAQLVVTGIAKFALDEEVNEAVGPLVGKRLFIHPEPPCSLADIRLSLQQQKLTEFLLHGKRIDELAAETTIPFDQIMRLLYSLAVIGIVVPEDQLPVGGPAEAAVAEASELPPVEIELEDPEQERNEVMAAYLRYRKQDAFDLLRIQEDATPREIERGYLEHARRFAPWKFEMAGLSGLIEKAEDLFLAGGRAFGELSDPECRNSLIVRRRGLREERAKKPVRDRFVIKSELLDSELQFEKGKKLMEAGHLREAMQQLQFAQDCDPQNSIYRAELAYCRFLESPRLEAEKSIEVLKDTLRIDPGCSLAVYYAGEVYGELGELEKAEDHLRRAIKLLMPDRRPIEGLKALQAKSKKRRRKRR